MPVDPATVSYLLSAIASAAKIIEFGLSLRGRSVTKKELTDVTRAAQKEAKLRFNASSPSVVNMSKMGWSQEIIDALRKQIDEITAHSVKIIETDTLDDHDKNKRLNDQRRKLCAHIEQIRRHNGGVLEDDLQYEWTKNCHDYVP